MRILITGGAGYVGSIIARYLKEKGHFVCLLDNLSTASGKNLQATLYQHDLINIAAVTKVLKKEKIDSVVHCAGAIVVSESIQNPYKYFAINTYATNCLLEAMHQANVHYLVFSSTSEVYGDTPTLPIVETMDKKPLNPYGLSKYMAEQEMEWADKAYGIKYVALRYMNAAGAYPDHSIGEMHNPETHIIPKAIRGVLGIEPFSLTYVPNKETPDGSPIRDFIHPVDLAHATELSLQYVHKDHTSDQFNLGSGEGYSVLEIVREIEIISGKTIERKFADTRGGEPIQKYASYGKIQKKLGWKPEFLLKDIIQTTYDFQKAHMHGYE